MTFPDIPKANALGWPSSLWQEYVSCWGSKQPVSQALYDACPGLFKQKEGAFCINKKIDRSHEVLSYATALMWRHALGQVCERLNVHPVDIAFSHDLSESSHRAPFIGTSLNPLTFQILIDAPSYSEQTVTKLTERLSHIMATVLHKRGVAEPALYIQIDDVREYPKGYSSPWRMRSGVNGLENGIESNPQLLHAWRSRSPSKVLTSAAAAGTLAHRGELYLRWLDGIEKPESIKPVDESTVESSWPSAMKFFHMWAALGIREHAALREVLSKVDTLANPVQALELPADFS